MKLTIRNRNLSSAKTLDALIETRLLALADRVRIDNATVLVECHPEASPRFRVELHLEVPGPDLRAEHIDNTPLQAFTRALAQIERQLRQRQANRLNQLAQQHARRASPRTVAGSIR